MKIVEDYAQRKVDESKRVLINFNKKGFSLEEIAETAEVSIDFVKQTLSN